jgi:hypothetical protein
MSNVPWKGGGGLKWCQLETGDLCRTKSLLSTLLVEEFSQREGHCSGFLPHEPKELTSWAMRMNKPRH